MENTKKYLANLAHQESTRKSIEEDTTNGASLSKLEAILNHIEDNAVSQRTSRSHSPTANADNIPTHNPLRRPSFSALESFLNSIDGGRGSSEPEVNLADSPSSVTKQIFFDCDNTLVDTEAIAVEACSIVVNKCLADHNIPEVYTVEELLISNFGETARKMITVLAKLYDFPITPEEISEYAKYEEDLVIELIHANPLPCDGIERLLQYLRKQGRYNLSVVSSSPIRRIRAALEAAGIAKYFDEDQVFSAKSSMPKPRPKPEPAIYNFAMAYNKIHPWQCVAFEDSRSGARSAINADIPCIAYLGTYSTPTQQEQVGATLLQEGCQEIMKSWSQAIACLERAEKAAAVEVAASLEKWDDLDERRRQYRMLLGQLLLEESRKAGTEKKV